MPDALAPPTLFALLARQLSFVLMGVVLLGCSRRSRRHNALLICALLVVAPLISCGGAGTLDRGPSPAPVHVASGTQAGSYTVTISSTTTGNMSPLSHSVTATLVVQ
jgi:hypothetical protein